MQRTQQVVLSVAVALMAAAASASPVTCLRAPATLQLDGSLSEWGDATPIALEPANDNTATVRVLWDDTYLYVAFDVTDANLWGDAKPNPWESFRNDFFEVYHDALNNGGSAPQSDDHRFRADFFDLATGAPHGETNGGEVGNGTVWVGWGPANAIWAAQLQGTANNNTDTDTGWTYEVAIDWASLGGAPASGETDGMTFVVGDDDDGSDAEGFGGVTGANVDQPDTWLDVTFSGTRAGGPFQILHAPLTLRVDGDLSDWAGAPAIPLTAANDNSGTVRFLWDAAFLYAAFEISDNELWGDAKPNPWESFRNDFFELFHDALNDGGAAPQTDDHRFRADFFDLATGAPHTETNGGEMGTGSGWAGWGPAGAQWAAQLQGTANNNTDTDTGWTYEVAIDWASLGGAPASGEVDAVSVSHGDDDDGADSEGFGRLIATQDDVPDTWLDVRYSSSVAGGPYTAQFGTAVIDGDLSDWSGADFFHVVGANDNSAEVALMYDSTNLYVAFGVFDQNLWGDAKPNPWETYRNDSVEIYFDAANDGGSAPQADDHQFHVDFFDVATGASHEETNGGEVGTGSGWTGWGPAPDAAFWAAQLGGTPNNDSDTDIGFTYELALPWDSIGVGAAPTGADGTRGGAVPAAGSIAAFTIGLTDDDDGGSSNEGFATIPGSDPQIPDTYVEVKFGPVVTATRGFELYR